MAIDIRYPRVVSVMLRNASRRDRPWQLIQAIPGRTVHCKGGSSILVHGGTVYDDIDGTGDRPCRHKQSGGPLFGGTDFCMTVLRKC